MQLTVDGVLAWIQSDPQTFLLTGFGAFTLLILLDLETGISLKLPGRRRLSFAGIILLGVVSTYIFLTTTTTGLLNRLAGSIFDALIIGAILAVVYMGARSQ